MSRRLAVVVGAAAVVVVAMTLGYRAGSQLGDRDPDGPSPWTAGWDAPQVWLEIRAPDVEFRDTEGGVARLTDYAGQIVLLNFWGTWCPPCLAEIPHLIEVQEVLAGLGGTIVGPAVGSGSAEDVLRFADEHGINYPLWLSDYETAVGRFGAAGYPFTLLIDGEGIIRKQYLGPQTARTLLHDIEALVGSRSGPGNEPDPGKVSPSS